MRTGLRAVLILFAVTLPWLAPGGVGVAWAQQGWNPGGEGSNVTREGQGGPLKGVIEIFIDARQPAYVVYQSVAADAPQAARDEMAGYAGLSGVTLVPWDVFRENVDRYIAAGMRINEYPQQRIALGILAVLKAHPGRPVAITWNGGIATSFFDFQHAVQAFEDFQENPVEYERKRAAGEYGDALNPERQIRAMLGN